MTQDPAVGSPRTQVPLAACGEGWGAEEAGGAGLGLPRTQCLRLRVRL